jgi:probable phosphoglycerate mutase
MSEPLRLFLVRHGETAWSITGRHTGLTDLALTAHGEGQARSLAARLVSTRFAHVLCSPLRRARETCELAGLGANAEPEPDLVEWDYGAYEGRRTADIQRDRPGWNVWIDGCPCGESPASISRRADRLLGRLRSSSGNVALFSHGQFGAALAARWIGLAVAEAQHLPLAPASLSILGYETGHPGVPVISLWNSGGAEL